MSIIKFQIMSDLHLETPKTRATYTDFKLEPICPNLVLLGDIGEVQHDQLFEFLETQLLHFDRVFFLLGNHEPYGLQYTDAVNRVRKFAAVVERERKAKGSNLGAFLLLNRNRYDLDRRVTVLGCTLFSHITNDQTESVSRFVSDFAEIQEWNVDSHNAAHERDLKWLNAQVSEIARNEPDRKIVIFTHYSPTKLAEANVHRHLKDAAGVGSAFVTDLSQQVCWKSKLVKLWAFGHTHFNCNFFDAATGKQVIANQKGYRRDENVTFSKDFVVCIEPSGGRSELKRERRKRIARVKQCTVQ